MNKLYAQLDVDGNVHTVCSLAGEIEDVKLIHVDSMDNQLLRSKYENKKFKKEIDNKMCEYDTKEKKFKEVK
jgi:hypothetical protein